MLLQTLQAHGFVEQDRHSDKYQLGPGLLQLGYSYLDLNELRARSIAYADRLAERARAPTLAIAGAGETARRVASGSVDRGYRLRARLLFCGTRRLPIEWKENHTYG